MFHKLKENTGGQQAALRLTCVKIKKLNAHLSNTLALGFTKAIKDPMDYKCLLDESYKKLCSTLPVGIWLFEINTTMPQIIITGFF